ncbi:MAG: NAD(P)/FAD-dependent oxidoreductase [Lentisphaeria bacterium]
MDYDVIIMGAGLSGLAAGIRLAYYGKKVAIFEKHALPGGLNSYFFRNGKAIDVGLHALTNFSDASKRGAPLNKLLRQLRLKREMFDLCPQSFSLIQFPETSLKMTNTFADFVEEVRQKFPADYDGFLQLLEKIKTTDYLSPDGAYLSARGVLSKYLSSELLQNMIFCPVMFYGNSSPNDMDFNQFCIMFNSLFLEGLGRPKGGMKSVIDILVQRYKELGGELKLHCGIRNIHAPNGSVNGVYDCDGNSYTAEKYLSTIGSYETGALYDKNSFGPSLVLQTCRPGELGFTETIFELNKRPSEFGIKASIIFRNEQEHFEFCPPEGAVDMRSQVICQPGNYCGCSTIASAYHLRLTHLANSRVWLHYSEEDYKAQKLQVIEAQKRLLDRLWPGMAKCIAHTEMFTPKTIQRYTGHWNGAIYGSPDKRKQGTTGLSNLFLAGTDQGFLGITGAMLSGVVIANRHLL